MPEQEKHKAYYDKKSRLLVVEGDFIARIPELTNTPLISYKNRLEQKLESEFISLIPYTVFKAEKGDYAQMTYRAGNKGAASVMAALIQKKFNIPIEFCY